MALNDSVKILKVTGCFTGSQCKDRKTGVTWSYLGVLVINVAAAFVHAVTWIWISLAVRGAGYCSNQVYLTTA